MPFFARPDLSNEQFKQLSGSTLTLSGTTQIAKIGGLEFIDEYGTPIPVIITGASDQDVLKYVCGCLTLGVVSTGGTSTGVYPYNECSTCTVGGLPAGSCLYNETIADILHDILVPTLYPSLIAPTSTFTISPATVLYEVGTCVYITGCSTLNMGCITPQYPPTSSPYRSGLPIQHIFSDWGTPYSATSTNIAYTFPFSCRQVVAGSNTVSGYVNYNCGVQPYDSKGNVYCTPLASGFTSSIVRTVCGVHPWFYGSSAGVPVIGDALLAGATCKCVALSTGDIVATNYNVTGQYIWFAIPATSTSMLKWQGSNSPSNCGTIPGDLFASETTCIVNSPSSCWSGINYRFYVSNYPTSINYCMTFKRS